MYPFCIQAPSNRAVSSCLLLNLSPRAVSGWSLRPHCKYSSSLESVLWLIYIVIYICHLTEFFLNPFIYQLCSKSVIVADINNRSEKMTNKPATLYARISCTRSFLAQRNKVKLIYIRLIWKKKNVFFPQERWKEANLEKHAFLDGFVAFGSGKYQCPGRSVRQPGHDHPQSLRGDGGDAGAERGSSGSVCLFFIIKLQGKPETCSLFGWPVILWDVFVRMSKVASDRRPQENKVSQLQLPDALRVYVSEAQFSYKNNSKGV